MAMWVITAIQETTIKTNNKTPKMVAIVERSKCRQFRRRNHQASGTTAQEREYPQIIREIMNITNE
jgi:hypothetical protein